MFQLLRSTLFAIALAVMLVPLPSMAASEEPAALPAWLQAQLDARGIAVDAQDIRVQRTVTVNGASTTFEVPFDALVQTNPFDGARVAPPATPEVLAGDLQFHLMLQSDCAGYGAQPVAAGLQAIEDATWEVGVHVAQGPLGGGRAVGTGAGVQNADSNLFQIAAMDQGMTLAAGQFSITYDRFLFFGTCILGVGQMSGTGAWVFS